MTSHGLSPGVAKGKRVGPAALLQRPEVPADEVEEVAERVGEHGYLYII